MSLPGGITDYLKCFTYLSILIKSLSMNVKNIWKIVKNRYRLSTKVQMNFELSFPEYLIGKCRVTTTDACEIRTLKIALSTKGVVFSDTIPLSWFTSSVLIPWVKVQKIAVFDTPFSIDNRSDEPLLSNINQQTSDFKYCRLRIDDPQEMTIDFPWSEKCNNYLQKHKLFNR